MRHLSLLRRYHDNKYIRPSQVNLKSASLLFSSNQRSVKLLTKYFLHSAPSFISSYPIPVFSFLVSTFFLYLALSLSPAAPEFPLSYTSHVVSTFFLFFLACLCLCPFHSALDSSILLLLTNFPLLRIPVPLVVFLSFSAFFFFSLQHSVSIRHSSLPSIISSNFAALFPAFTFSLFLLHSSIFCPLLAPILNIFLALSLLPLVSSISRSLPRTSVYSYYALKHHNRGNQSVLC
jgi:hypothetical protein